MFLSPEENTTNRNVAIIKAFQDAKKVEGVRNALKSTGGKFGLSSKTVEKVIYDREYYCAAEAWAIIDAENESEKEGAANAEQSLTAARLIKKVS